MPPLLFLLLTARWFDLPRDIQIVWITSTYESILVVIRLYPTSRIWMRSHRSGTLQLQICSRSVSCLKIYCFVCSRGMSCHLLHRRVWWHETWKNYHWIMIIFINYVPQPLAFKYLFMFDPSGLSTGLCVELTNPASRCMDETWWNLVWWHQRGQILHEISWCRLSPRLSSDFNSLKHCILEGVVPHSSWYMIDYYSMFLRTPDLQVFLSANSILQENHEETVNQHQEVNQFEDCGWVVPDFPDYLDYLALLLSLEHTVWK